MTSYIRRTNNNKLVFGTNDENRLIIKNNGNVGIGVTEPEYNLDVSGNVLQQNIVSTGFFFTEEYNESITESGFNLWEENGSDKYYNAGNVGIGTTTPGYELDVSGDINYTGIMYNNGLKSGYMILLETREVTSSTQYVDFPNLLTDDYTVYKVFFTNFTGSSDNQDFQFVLSSDNGSSYQYGSGYGWVGYQDFLAHTGQATNLNRHPLIAWTETDNGANATTSGNITICNPTNTNVVTSMYSRCVSINDADVCVEHLSHSYRNVKQKNDAFRFFFASGNVLTANVSVYGLIR